MSVVTRIPAAPGLLPVIGHGGALLRDPLRFLAKVANSGDLAYVKIGPLRTIAVCRPDLVRSVFHDDRTFDKGGRLYDLVKEVTGTRSAVVMAHAEHRTRRRRLQPAFHPSRFPKYVRIITEQAEAVTSGWEDGQKIDLFEQMKLVTARAGLLTMFTYMQPEWVLTRALDDSITVMDGLFRRIIVPSVMNRIPTPGNLRFTRANARLRDAVDRIIDEYRRDDVDCDDLISTLLAPGNGPSDDVITNTDVQDEVQVFFLAAMETNAALLSWTFTELLRHPEVFERVRQEIESELAGAPAGLNDLPRLTFTRQVLQENLRLHPPVWLVTRTATVDTELAGHPVPAGSTVLLSPYIVHQREEVFPDPRRFDPDRWSEERQTKQARESLIPFGFGARKCIGDVFGMTEALLTVAHVVQNWSLEPDSAVARPATSFVLSPRNSCARVTRIR